MLYDLGPTLICIMMFTIICYMYIHINKCFNINQTSRYLASICHYMSSILRTISYQKIKLYILQSQDSNKQESLLASCSDNKYFSKFHKFQHIGISEISEFHELLCIRISNVSGFLAFLIYQNFRNSSVSEFSTYWNFHQKF